MSTPEPKPQATNLGRVLPWALLVGTILVYLNSLAGEFVFDDVPRIVEDPAVRRLELAPILATPRPLVTLSLALNYALDPPPPGQPPQGLEPRGFHLFNIFMHALAGLALYGVARRTLTTPTLAPRFGAHASTIAAAAALLWLVHPLNTQAVSYVIQRAEVMMALFYLLTLYAAIRAATEARPWLWGAGSVLACVLALASKEIAVTAPVVVLLYDRTFLAGSFAGALRRRGLLYVGLVLTWLVPLWLGLAKVIVSSDASAGFALPLWTWDQYARTQPLAILTYLRLALWPHPLILDYWQQPARGPVELGMPMLVLALIVIGTLVALWRFRTVGFLAACFLLILAPTSSIVPVADMIVEHRAYLPLAAVVVGLTAGGSLIFRRWGRERLGLVLAFVVAVALAARTAARNNDYRDAETIWRSVIRHKPLNDRAYHNLAANLWDVGRIDEALAAYDSELSIRPKPGAYNDLGRKCIELGLAPRAIDYFRKAIALEPREPEPHARLGFTLMALGQYREAREHLRHAVDLTESQWPPALGALAWLLATCPDDAVRDGRQALALAEALAQTPAGNSPTALDTLAAAHAEAGDFASALAAARRALQAARDAGNPPLAQAIEARLKLYEAGKPYRESRPPKS